MTSGDYIRIRLNGGTVGAKALKLLVAVCSLSCSLCHSMNWILASIKWIMVVSGVLTATMMYAAIAPEAALQSTFGETLNEPLAKIIVRNWGALIALVGGMLIYGAFRPDVRSLVLIVAGLSKVVFITLVLSQGRRYLSQQAGTAIVIDSVMVALFAWYLAASVIGRKV
jgi:hypothetical protein